MVMRSITNRRQALQNGMSDWPTTLPDSELRRLPLMGPPPHSPERLRIESTFSLSSDTSARSVITSSISGAACPSA